MFNLKEELITMSQWQFVMKNNNFPLDKLSWIFLFCCHVETDISATVQKKNASLNNHLHHMFVTWIVL